MYSYSFTNDLRISDLSTKIRNAATKIYTETVPNPNNGPSEQSENNNIQALRSYFKLDSTTNCNEYARNNQERVVIMNFIKKFQYPNFRTRSSFENARDNNIRLAPLREMIKILYVAYLQEGNSGYLTKNEILDFIFFNSKVAKEAYPNYIEVYQQVLEFRENGVLPDNIASEDEREWRGRDRQIGEMLKILEYVSFVNNENSHYSLISTEHLTVQEKADLLDVFTMNDYWEGDTAESYAAYFDLQPMEVASNDISVVDCEDDVDIEYNQVLHNPLQKIYFGPPGTGKSYGVSELIMKTYPTYNDHSVHNPYVFRTAIHPEYSYFDFLGSIMPVSNRTDNGVEINYEFQEGIFTRALKQAYDTEYDVFLILEEMSRGNVVSVFGDVFQLLDRKDDGTSEYTINIPIVSTIINGEVGVVETENQGIYLPSNLHIIGTVNTSDQNVFVMDTAFKRRFEFEYVDPDPISGLNHFELLVDTYILSWNQFYPVLNEFMIEKLDLSEDKQIGQFFIKFKENDSDFNNSQISNKLLQYLWNDVHLVKMTSSSLFKEDIRSFSKLYKQCKKESFTDLFSSEFKNYLVQTIGKELIENVSRDFPLEEYDEIED